jgi:two-component system sensor histidine kinase YesM
MTYLIILISILLALCLAWLVYSEISKPLRKLFGAIKQFSGGHLLANIKHGRKDEFGLLMNAFNRMAESQRKLIEEDYEKELKLARSEFSLLQSQINPHFLYNTLDSIYSVADKHKIKEIGEMVLNLAQFFRFSLGKGKETFTLEETIQHLMYYIRVQQIRTDQFTVEMDIAEDTKPIPVLKLLLQPIVENAIVHGICKSSYGGDLYIRSRLIDGLLRITIEDTGCGIVEDELTEIKQELQKINAHSYRYVQEKGFSKYFGLKNVTSRMKMFYGNQAEMTVDHNALGGTRVIVNLPIERVESA